MAQRIKIDQQNTEALVFFLSKSMDENQANRKQAEQELIALKDRPGYVLLLIHIIQQQNIPLHLRMMASILLKNFIKAEWDEEIRISAEEKKEIRSILPSLLLSMPKQLYKQLSAALAIVSEFDFPAQWMNLLPELVNQLGSAPNPEAELNILKIIDTILKRFRKLCLTNVVEKELIYIVGNLAKPLMEKFQVILQRFEATANNTASLAVLLNEMLVIASIFYSLNYVDLPAFFEDNLIIWMEGFSKFLIFSSEESVLLEGKEEQLPGVLPKLKTRIISNISLYVDKYQEEFEPYLQKFVQIIWDLLIKTPPKKKFDKLIMAAVGLLTSISKSVYHKVFERSETLHEICIKIIVPNIKLRKLDFETFEDDPADYILSDVEGSNAETKRKSAYDLVKGLRKNYEKAVTEICFSPIQSLLQEYKTNPSENWQSKDAALYLLGALATSGATQAEGVVTVNPYCEAQILPCFQNEVLPELEAANAHPLIKASCLTFVKNFRRSFPVNSYPKLFEIFTVHLSSQYYVVHSYAAMCIEKFLTMTDRNGPSRVRRVTKEMLKPYLQSFLQYLLVELKPSESLENHYTMKAINRIVAASREDILLFLPQCVDALSQKLSVIYKAPSNPEFAYYLFDCLGNLINVSCTQNPSVVETFENNLFPIFSKVLMEPGADVYSPFVFQLISLLIEKRGGEMSPIYHPMLKEFTSPALWEQPGNLPALTRLLQDYLTYGSRYVVSSKLLLNILGVFQKLISTKSNYYLGFLLLQTMVEYLYYNDYAFALPEIFKLIFIRLQSFKSGPFMKSFVVFLSYLIGKVGPNPVYEQICSIQPNIFMTVINSLWIPYGPQVTGKVERKAEIIALTKLLCECNYMHASPYLETWPCLFGILIGLLEGVVTETKTEVANEQDLEEDKQYTSGYTDLRNASKVESDPFSRIIDTKKYVAGSFQAVSSIPVVQSTLNDEEYRKILFGS